MCLNVRSVLWNIRDAPFLKMNLIWISSLDYLQILTSFFRGISSWIILVCLLSFLYVNLTRNAITVMASLRPALGWWIIWIIWIPSDFDSWSFHCSWNFRRQNNSIKCDFCDYFCATGDEMINHVISMHFHANKKYTHFSLFIFIIPIPK